MRSLTIVITGSRSLSTQPGFLGYLHADLSLLKSTYDEVRLIHGTAMGVDRTAGRVADSMDMPVKGMPADWDTFGKRAGYVRNEEMLDFALKYQSESSEDMDVLVLAYWDMESPGTAHCIESARKRDMKVCIRRIAA